MDEMTALFGIAVALAIGAASPGPSFVLVARVAVSSSRRDALFAAIGMGLGGLLFACAALLGLQGLLLAVPSLYLVLKVAGGLYLVYLGFRIWRGATEPLTVDPNDSNAGMRSARRSLLLGLGAQVSNPKTAIVYASVFAAFLPAGASLFFNACVMLMVFTIETGWYALVAVSLSSARPRSVYLRFKKWIDRTASSVMMALGLKLIFAGRP